MKKIVLSITALFYHFILIAQPVYSFDIGDEIKAEKGFSAPEIIAADKDHIYYTVERITERPTLGQYVESTVLLNKIDQGHKTIFSKKFNRKELGGRSFSTFRTLGDEIYLFVNETQGSLTHYFVTRIDKQTGEPAGEFVKFSSKNYGDNKVRSNLPGNAGFLDVVRNDESKNKVSFSIFSINKELKNKEEDFFELPFEPRYYRLIDIEKSIDNKIILLGMEFKDDPAESKNQRKIYSRHVITVFDRKTKRLLHTPFEPGENKNLAQGTLLQEPGGNIFIAGFYSISTLVDSVRGFYVHQVDGLSGKTHLISSKEIDHEKLGKGFIDPSDKKKMTDKVEKDLKSRLEEEFPGFFIIKEVHFDPADSSFILVTELSDHSSYNYTRGTGSSGSISSTHTAHVFKIKDVLVTKLDRKGGIKTWTIIPKVQLEVTSGDGINGTFFFSYSDHNYFTPFGEEPSFSSFKSIFRNSQLVLLMNDHPLSTDAEPITPARLVTFTRKNTCYLIFLDVNSGKMIRKPIYENTEKTYLLPRLSTVTDNGFYLLMFGNSLFTIKMRIAHLLLE